MTVVDGMVIVTHVSGLLVFSIPADAYFFKAPFLSYASFLFSFKMVLWAKFSLVLYTAILIKLTSMDAFSPLMAEFSSYDSCLSGS